MQVAQISKQMAVVFAAICSAQARGSCWNLLPVEATTKVKGFNIRIGKKSWPCLPCQATAHSMASIKPYNKSVQTPSLLLGQDTGLVDVSGQF